MQMVDVKRTSVAHDKRRHSLQTCLVDTELDMHDQNLPVLTRWQFVALTGF